MNWPHKDEWHKPEIFLRLTVDNDQSEHSIVEISSKHSSRNIWDYKSIFLRRKVFCSPFILIVYEKQSKYDHLWLFLLMNENQREIEKTKVENEAMNVKCLRAKKHKRKSWRETTWDTLRLSEKEDCIKGHILCPLKKRYFYGSFWCEGHSKSMSVENRDMQRPSGAGLGSGSNAAPTLPWIYGGLSRLL